MRAALAHRGTRGLACSLDFCKPSAQFVQQLLDILDVQDIR